MQPPEKIDLIRASMKEIGIDAYIIPSNDPHLGEYVPDHWRIIRWLTGFTGSAGTLVITQNFAGLWTDSRYFIQAENQLAGSGIVLMKPSAPEKSGFISWLINNLPAGNRIGLDGRLFSIGRYRKIKAETKEHGIETDGSCDLVTPVWTDRPSLSSGMAFDHLVVFAGHDRGYKLSALREEMKKHNAEFHFLTSPDDIMWLLNIRGSDLPHSPVILSFAIAGPDQVLWFVNEEKIPYKLALELDKLGVVMLPYEEVSGMIATLSGNSILVSPETTSAELFYSIPPDFKIIEDISIPTRLKCIRNSTEIENIPKAMVRDGVALTKFFFQVERSLEDTKLTEVSLTNLLDRIRAEQENFVSLSFQSIVAFGPHAALPHYSASAETDIPVTKDGILLVDSGSHYLDGTTDITRTIATGKPAAQQKRDYTLVLKGMISLAEASFPAGTYGYQLDILARKHLWQNGLNYGHGTGHGVGYCLSVHEGPQRISVAAGGEQVSIMPGMVLSDEPAIYREGDYGIRIENLLLCYEDEETEFGKFNRFSTLSLCYIDTSLIEPGLLDKKETDWLNNYHREVFERISPYLSAEERSWLEEKTRPILASSQD